MQTTGRDDVFQEPPAPLRPATGRLTLVFLAMIALGLLVELGLDEPTGDGTGGTLTGVAPEVALTGFDGASWRLSQHLSEDGRPVVLNLWASWCLPCREEMPELSTFADAHPEFAVVGVAVQDREPEARRLVAEVQPTYLVGMDATGRLRERYPSVGMPLTVVIDGQGVIRWTKTGGVTADELEEATSLFG